MDTGHWPMVLIVKTFSSRNDGKLRTVEIRVVRDDKVTTYIRPITELVLDKLNLFNLLACFSLLIYSLDFVSYDFKILYDCNILGILGGGCDV